MGKIFPELTVLDHPFPLSSFSEKRFFSFTDAAAGLEVPLWTGPPTLTAELSGTF